jgi:ABC-type antimicrobial peptide transport system permease subunit
MHIPPAIAGGGILLGVLVGLAAGLVPSLAAFRTRITELLRPI